MKEKAFSDIPPHRREIYFRIINGEQDFHPITLRLHFLNDHFPIDKLDRALKWLIAHNIVGKLFVNWFRMQCHNSDLEMHSRLLRVVDNMPLAPIIAGKNFKV
jgi:hypothetical protein